MLDSQFKKCEYIVRNWIKGNKQEAADRICKLTKLELFYLCSSHASTIYILEKSQRYNFEQFIENSLNGFYK